jgi:hypothetical protein
MFFARTSALMFDLTFLPLRLPFCHHAAAWSLSVDEGLAHVAMWNSAALMTKDLAIAGAAASSKGKDGKRRPQVFAKL